MSFGGGGEGVGHGGIWHGCAEWQAKAEQPIVRHAPGMLNARRRWGGLEGASGCGFQACRAGMTAGCALQASVIPRA